MGVSAYYLGISAYFCVFLVASDPSAKMSEKPKTEWLWIGLRDVVVRNTLFVNRARVSKNSLFFSEIW